MAAVFSPNPHTAEEGGTSPFSWDAVNTGTGTTFTLSNAQAYAGTYSYAAYANATTNTAYGQDTFTGVGVFYLDYYLYIPSSLRGGAWDYCACSVFGNDEYNNVSLLIGFVGDNTPAGWTILGAGEASWDFLTTGFATDVWLHIEMLWDYGAGGTTTLWFKVNGETVYTSSTLTCSWTTTTFANIGMAGLAGSPVTGTLYFDSIYGYDAIPAPPSGGAPVAVFLHQLREQGIS